ncbi:MAG: prepilin-type N-terminal cleavage/methylation domain-containing protein [Pseudomonadota bacterium]
MRGYTLVELAIVMLVIGLLVAGFLRGKELLSGGQVTAAITAQDDLRKAIMVFRNNYYAYPGDLMTPDTTLNNCDGVICSRSGNGNGIIGVAIDNPTPMSSIFKGTSTFPDTENSSAWAQLAAAEILHKTVPEPTSIDAGQSHPAAAGGGVYHVLYNATGLGIKIGTAEPARSGHYLMQAASAQVDGNNYADNAVWLSHVMERLDKKIDDGMPFTGNVLGFGQDVGALCATGPGASALYSQSGQCNALFRITD